MKGGEYETLKVMESAHQARKHEQFVRSAVRWSEEWIIWSAT